MSARIHCSACDMKLCAKHEQVKSDIITQLKLELPVIHPSIHNSVISNNRIRIFESVHKSQEVMCKNVTLLVRELHCTIEQT